MSKDLREEREQMLETSGGPEFKAEETCHAKALKKEHSWCSRRRSEVARVAEAAWAREKRVE